MSITAKESDNDLCFRADKLKVPSSLSIYGPSFAGKSSFVARLISKANCIYERPISRIVYFYRVWDPNLFPKLEREHDVEFIQGPLTCDWVNENIAPPPADGGQKTSVELVVSDDWDDISVKETPIWTAMIHHLQFCVVLLLHEMFSKNPAYRIISLNSTYIMVMRYIRDCSVAQCLGKQFDAYNPRRYHAIYKAATAQPYSYLFHDLHQSTPDKYRLRSNILCENGEPISIWERL